MSEEIVAVGPVLPDSLGDAIRTALCGGDCSAIVSELERLTAKLVSGLIVYGSMAQPANASKLGKSDVDMLLLVAEPACGGIFGISGNIEIDMHVQARSAALAEPFPNVAPYADGRVLFDENEPELETWLRDVLDWKQGNPDPWSAADRVRIHAWAQRIVNRVTREARDDAVAAAMHEARLLAELPNLYVMVKHRRVTSTSKWWAALKRQDPAFFERLSNYVASRPFPPDGFALQQLVDELFKAN
jgi:hypothetical protein